MEWQGLLGFLFLFLVLTGVVYVGANTDKFNFGEPSAISRQNDLPSFSFTSISTGDFFPRSEINIDKIQSDLENKLLYAKSEQEARQIIEDTYRDLFSDPRMQGDCDRVMKELKNLQARMTQWVESGKNYQLYPMENERQLLKELQICGFAEGAGYVDLSP